MAMSLNSNYRRPLIVSTTTLALGLSASLAGNLQAIHLNGALPGIGQYIAAMIWPVFLFAAIEIMLHTPWINAWRDHATKAAAVIGIAFVSFWISYWHMKTVLTVWGYDTVAAHSGPLAIDILMITATMSLNRAGQARRATYDTGPYVPASPWGDSDYLPEDYSVGDEAESYLARLEREKEEVFRPTPPVPVIAPVSPAPHNLTSVDSIPDLARELLTAWLNADPKERPAKGEVDELVAGALVVNGVKVRARTVRRYRYSIENGG